MQCVLLVKHLMMSLVMRVQKVVNMVEDEKKVEKGFLGQFEEAIV
jgi:hypothetical protein